MGEDPRPQADRTPPRAGLPADPHFNEEVTEHTRRKAVVKPNQRRFIDKEGGLYTECNAAGRRFNDMAEITLSIK